MGNCYRRGILCETNEIINCHAPYLVRLFNCHTTLQHNCPATPTTVCNYTINRHATCFNWEWKCQAIQGANRKCMHKKKRKQATVHTSIITSPDMLHALGNLQQVAESIYNQYCSHCSLGFWPMSRKTYLLFNTPKTNNKETKHWGRKLNPLSIVAVACKCFWS